MLVKGNRIDMRPPGPGLVIQLGDIGDVVLTLPTLQALKEHAPRDPLYVCVREKAHELLIDSPWVDGVIPVGEKHEGTRGMLRYQLRFLRDLRRRDIRWAIDLRTGDRGAILAYLSGAQLRLGWFSPDGRLWRNRLFSHLADLEDPLGIHVAEYGLKLLSCFGIASGVRGPVLAVSAEKEKAAAAILRKAGVRSDRPIASIHPFSLWRYKELPISTCASVIDRLSETHRFSVIITGSAAERDRADLLAERCRAPVFNLAGKTTLGELAAVLRACSLFIGVDSAALHIAAAVGTPTVGIFGPSSPKSWAPRGPGHVTVSKRMDCIPCRQKGCGNQEISRCMIDLCPEEITAAVGRLSLSGEGAPLSEMIGFK